jgi:copper oxidase (laccase) domain-containing protein
MEIETFPALRLLGLRHGFSTRSRHDFGGLEAEMRESFSQQGFPVIQSASGEQPHGNRIAAVQVPGRVAGVDALSTSTPGLPLVVRVADCGPVFFYDSAKRVIALAHSGRRGTEGNIVAETLAHLVVQLGPCIRPPHYEIDFAAEIGRQAAAAGVIRFHDCGTCTACNLDRYYSYRAEKGQTGRMWAMLMLETS